MFTKAAISNIYVLDQEEALDFYVGKLGFEKRADIDLGFMRWLTVGIPGDEHEYLLELTDAPHYGDNAAALRDLVTKGMAGAKFIYTDDCRKTFEQLKAAGVEITEEPTERFYGIDMGARDPFGNPLRITQPKENWDPVDPSQFG